MLLTVVEHVLSWNFTAKLSRTSGSTYEKFKVGFLKAASAHKYDAFVQRMEKNVQYEIVVKKIEYLNFLITRDLVLKSPFTKATRQQRIWRKERFISGGTQAVRIQSGSFCFIDCIGFKVLSTLPKIRIAQRNIPRK